MAISSDDPEKLMSEVNAKLAIFMNVVAVTIAKGQIAQAVVDHVYPSYIYSPSEYKRRMANGGLIDMDLYEVVEDSGSSDVHEIVVSDNRHEVGVVESGTGYTWSESRIYKMQPYPRPYFKTADEKALEEIDSGFQNFVNTI